MKRIERAQVIRDIIVSVDESEWVPGDRPDTRYLFKEGYSATMWSPRAHTTPEDLKYIGPVGPGYAASLFQWHLGVWLKGKETFFPSSGTMMERRASSA